MHANRALLFAGVFLAALGGVLVAADLRSVDTPTLTDVLRLWPLAIVAIGIGLVLRRSRLRLPTLIAAAALPGIVLGSALAVAPRFVADCGARGEPASVAATSGTFDGPAVVSVRTGCGSLLVTTAPGNGWTLDARNTAGHAPFVSPSARSLSIESAAHNGDHVFDAGRDAWSLALPTTELERLTLAAFAGDAQLDLSGARIDRLALTVNASDVVIDATTASIADLSGIVNVGQLSLRLPAASDLTGSVRVGAGDVRICAPPGLGLRIRADGTAEQLQVQGVRQTGSIWQNPAYASATHRAELTVTAHFGAIEIDPIGGCS